MFSFSTYPFASHTSSNHLSTRRSRDVTFSPATKTPLYTRPHCNNDDDGGGGDEVNNVTRVLLLIGTHTHTHVVINSQDSKSESRTLPLHMVRLQVRLQNEKF